MENEDLISEFEFDALSVVGKIMPVGSNTFLFMGVTIGGRGSFKTI